MNTIVVTNQKDGPGKSTLAVLYAHWLADKQRERVCVIDLDSQRSSSKTLSAFDCGVAATELFAPAPIALPAAGPGELVLFGGARGLFDLERAKPDVVIPAFRQQVAALNQAFDAVVIDTPPALGVRMSAALIAADYVACPIELEEYSNRSRDRHAEDGVRRAPEIQPVPAAAGHHRQPLQPALAAAKGGARAPDRALRGVRDPGQDLDPLGDSRGTCRRYAGMAARENLGARSER